MVCGATVLGAKGAKVGAGDDVMDAVVGTLPVKAGTAVPEVLLLL